MPRFIVKRRVLGTVYGPRVEIEKKVKKEIKLVFRARPIEVPPYEGVVYIYYYDPGSDMDFCDYIYIKIKPDAVEFRKLSIDEAEQLGVYGRLLPKPWEVEALKIVNKLVDRINEKQCPFCQRRMKVVYEKKARKPNESYGVLRARYPDVMPYDVEEEFWFTCFRCGIRAGAYYETCDGGAGLHYRFWIEVPSRGRAEYNKWGFYTNEERLFWALAKFFEDLWKLGLIRVKEKDSEEQH